MTMPVNTSGSSGSTSTPPESAVDVLSATLAAYGVPSLSDWAWGQLVAGVPTSQILLELPQQQAFKDEFPEIQARQAAGLPPLTAGEIVSYRRAAQEAMQAAGLPKGFWDSKEDFTNLITNGVSLNELQDRINLAKQATYGVPQEVRDVMARDYGMTDGHWTANFLDPTQAEPLLQKHFLSAQIGGTAHITGYETTRAQNERLADMGITDAQARQGFNQLANSRELTQSLPGEHTTGISADDQLAAVFGGNADAQRALTRRADERKAVFGAGGGFASNQGGTAGAGSAQGA